MRVVLECKRDLCTLYRSVLFFSLSFFSFFLSNFFLVTRCLVLFPHFAIGAMSFIDYSFYPALYTVYVSIIGFYLLFISLTLMRAKEKNGFNFFSKPKRLTRHIIKTLRM